MPVTLAGQGANNPGGTSSDNRGSGDTLTEVLEGGKCQFSNVIGAARVRET